MKKALLKLDSYGIKFDDSFAEVGELALWTLYLVAILRVSTQPTAAQKRAGWIALVSAVIGEEVVNSSIKTLLARERPYQYQASAPRIWGHPLMNDRSMPSGHAGRSAALAAVALQGQTSPELVALVLALVAVSSSARVVGGYHHWSDVLVGAINGAAVGVAASYTAQQAVDGGGLE